MFTDTSRNVTITGDLDTDSTEMTLDQDGMVHLMSMLTNLYSDKHQAVLREYSTNARDSHVAAGNTDPIRVTLPNALNPTLVISDQGVGLSRDEIIGVYAKYGASTKRSSNTQVGSFGLGAKSAFTIGTQFIVTATKDEARTVAVFALNAHGVGTVNILDERAVPGAPNGVTVDIAVSDHWAMRRAAAEFFRAWEPGTVLVDGAEPQGTYFTDESAQWLGDDVLYSKGAGLTVIMGAVAYPLTDSAIGQVRSRTGALWPMHGGDPGLVVFVPIGAVDITPSRESIRDTARSIDAIVAVLDNLTERISDRIEQVKAAHPANQTALVLAAQPWLKLAKQLGIKTDKLAALPGDIILPPGAVTSYGLTARGGLSVTQHGLTISAGFLHQLVVLVGVPERRSARRHAKAWLEENGNYRRHTLLMIGDGAATDGTLDWFGWGCPDEVPTVHYDDIDVPEIVRGGASRSKIAYASSVGTSGGLIASRERSLAEIKADGRPVAWVGAYIREDQAPALDGYLVISLSGRQSLEVLQRRLPGVVSGRDLTTAYMAAKLAAVGDLEALGLSMAWDSLLNRVADMFGGRRLAQLTSPVWTAQQAKAAPYRVLSDDDQMLVRRNVTRRDNDDVVKTELMAIAPLLAHVTQNYWMAEDEVKDALVTYVNALV